MLHDFTALREQLDHAASPVDIFGTLTGDQGEQLKRTYRQLVAVAHPDHNRDREAEAARVFQQLHAWYLLAQRSVAAGSYGTSPIISAQSKTREYLGYESPLAGDLCDLFPCDAGGARYLLKVVRHPRDNDLLQIETRNLRQLDHALTGQLVRAHFPTLVEQFQLRDAAGQLRHVNVLAAEAGYVSLAQVLQAYPSGLDLADAAWMFNRLLAALAITHDQGIVHGAVILPHILIRPADHNGMLVDWCYSVAVGEQIKAISPPYRADYPPEVEARAPATPATDIAMAARCMLRLLGGDPATATLPPRVPRAIQALLRSCVLPAPARRPHDAWEVLDDFREILGQLYGPPVFRPFTIPG